MQESEKSTTGAREPVFKEAESQENNNNLVEFTESDQNDPIFSTTLFPT